MFTAIGEQQNLFETHHPGDGGGSRAKGGRGGMNGRVIMGALEGM